MSEELQLLFHQHVALSWEKQLALNAWAGELDWGFDMDSGMLSFSDGSNWRAQILGTESEETESWLWAWANEESDIPPDLIRMSKVLNRFGKEREVPELIESTFVLEGFRADDIALIASGVCRAGAYYRCPYDGGAMYLLLDDPALPGDPRPVGERIVPTFTNLIARYDVPDHQTAFEAYVTAHGLKHTAAPHLVNVVAGKKRLKAEFDNLRRLVRLSEERN